MEKIQVVDTTVKNDLLKFGARDWHECYQCGNCTALCPLSDSTSLFPRKVIKQAQMGIKRSLMANVDPWLCYYCGECSASCPRDANPGELMMSMRRYLTSLYDWTGLSRKFYMNHRWEIGAVLIMGAFIVALFAIFSPPRNVGLNDEGGVLLNSFAPIFWIELGDLLMAAIVASLLISNILHMFYRVILSPGIRVPLKAYFTEFWKLIWHFGTQARFSKCDKGSRKYWYSHWLLMSGYVIMFALVVGFLPWFQTETIHPIWHPQRFLGYYATIGLMIGLVYVIIGRIRKKDQKFRYSHYSDWIFIVMLLITTVSGILVHFFRIGGLPMATYYTYVIHLAVLVPMIMVEVPFSKWSHLAYRPFAVYLAALRKAASERATVENSQYATA